MVKTWTFVRCLGVVSDLFRNSSHLSSLVFALTRRSGRQVEKLLIHPPGCNCHGKRVCLLSHNPTATPMIGATRYWPPSERITVTQPQPHLLPPETSPTNPPIPSPVCHATYRSRHSCANFSLSSPDRRLSYSARLETLHRCRLRAPVNSFKLTTR